MTDERTSRCGPLSRCARYGHVDRIGGGPIEGHVWRDEEYGAHRRETGRITATPCACVNDCEFDAVPGSPLCAECQAEECPVAARGAV